MPSSPMRASRKSTWTFAVALFATCLLGSGRPAHAWPFDPQSRDWEGIAEFIRIARAELGERVAVPRDLDFATLQREDGLVLVHPEAPLDVENLTAFMRKGGRVILLDDFGTGERLLAHFGLTRVAAPESPAERLRRNPALALAEPAGPHPLTYDVKRVVTNHPTGIRHPALTPVLKIRAASGPDVLLAQAGAVGAGRLLVVADPSIAINSMLRYPGNRRFCRGLVRYAVDDDTWGRRGGYLRVLTGNFGQRGAFGAEGSERGIRARARAFSAWIRSSERSGFSPGATYAVGVVIGAGIVAWIGARAGRPNERSVPRFARSIPLSAHGGIAGHAAVVMAPSTPRAVAMLELKTALEESLSSLLGHDRVPAHDVLAMELLEAGLLDDRDTASLKRLLVQMATIETKVRANRDGTLPRVRERDVVEAAASMTRILSTATANAKGERR